MSEPQAAKSETPAQQEQQLLSLLKRGQFSAMESLVRRYQDRLFVSVLRIVQNPDDAADIVQETFFKALQGIRRFEGKSSLYTWLFRIAVNLSINLRRKRKSQPTQSLDGWAAQANGSTHPSNGTGGAGGTGGNGQGVNQQVAHLRQQLAQDTELDPALEAALHIDHGQVLEALGWLAPDQRAIIVLRDIEDCDYEQISEILEVPLGTIKSRIFRARVALRKEVLRLHQKNHAVKQQQE